MEHNITDEQYKQIIKMLNGNLEDINLACGFMEILNISTFDMWAFYKNSLTNWCSSVDSSKIFNVHIGHEGKEKIQTKYLEYLGHLVYLNLI